MVPRLIAPSPKAENVATLLQSPDHLDISVVVFNVVVADAAGVEVSGQSASSAHFRGVDSQLGQPRQFILVVQVVISRQLYHPQLVLRPSSA